MTTRTRAVLAAAMLLTAPGLPGLLGAQGVGRPGAGDAPGDTVARRPLPPLVTRREAAWTLAGTAASVALMQFDTRIARWIMDPSRHSDRLDARVEKVALVNEKTLLGAELVLWGVGRLTRNETLADAGWHAAEAVAITTVGTTIVRVAVGRSRPFKSGGRDPFDFHPFTGWDDQAYRAIPSIHAASAFATAAAVTAEVRRRRPGLTKVVAPVSFALAALPGIARMHDDKHWASDVALGAVWGTTIGIATVRWHHARTDDRLDRWMLGASRAPNGDALVTLGRALPR